MAREDEDVLPKLRVPNTAHSVTSTNPGDKLRVTIFDNRNLGVMDEGPIIPNPHYGRP
jgi:hypothetical protein